MRAEAAADGRRAHSVLVVRLSSLGDIVHTLHAVCGLKRARPETRVGWVVERRFAELPALFACVDEVFPVEIKKGPREALSSLASLRRRVDGRYGLVCDLHGLLKSALAARFAAGGTLPLWGFAPPNGRELSYLLYSRRVPVPARGHVVERRRHLLEAALGLEFAAERRLLAVLPPAPALRRPYVVLAAGTSRRAKIWPPEHQARLAGLLSDDFAVYVSGSPRERHLVEEVTRTSEAEPAPPVSLAGLAALLAGAEVVVGGDTGPVHLASALGRPVVALFGPNDAALTGPYGPSARVLVSERACRPCGRRYCRYARGDYSPCLADISPEEVAQAVRDAAGRPRP